MTWVKICGLVRREDAEKAIEYGADAVGFVFEGTSPRRVGGLDWNPEWLSELKAEKVAVFGPAPPALPEGPFDTIQAFEWARSAPLGGRIKQKVVRLGPTTTAEFVLRELASADRIVLDAYSRLAYGGTGETVDLDLAAEITKASKLPIVLAGGLTPDTVAEAILKVKPFGVDVASGVETAPGAKDWGKMRAFIEIAKATVPEIEEEEDEPLTADDW